MTTDEKLTKIERLLTTLVERGAEREHYEIEEFAQLVRKAPFTVRAWARTGRIKAQKKLHGRGKYARWVIAHGELLRYRKEGLLPKGDV